MYIWFYKYAWKQYLKASALKDYLFPFQSIDTVSVMVKGWHMMLNNSIVVVKKKRFWGKWHHLYLLIFFFFHKSYVGKRSRGVTWQMAQKQGTAQCRKSRQPWGICQFQVQYFENDPTSGHVTLLLSSLQVRKMASNHWNADWHTRSIFLNDEGFMLEV